MREGDKTHEMREGKLSQPLFSDKFFSTKAKQRSQNVALNADPKKGRQTYALTFMKRLVKSFFILAFDEK